MMRHEHVETTKPKFSTLLLVSLLIMGAIWLAVAMPGLLDLGGIKVVKWVMWIVAYFAAQLLVGMVIGRVIRGPESHG